MGLPNVHSERHKPIRNLQLPFNPFKSCFAHAVNLAVGAFINALSPKQASSSGTGEEPVVPGPVPSRSYNESDVVGEEDSDEVIETLHQKLNEMEKEPGAQSSSVRGLSLLLRVRAFVTKVG